MSIMTVNVFECDICGAREEVRDVVDVSRNVLPPLWVEACLRESIMCKKPPHVAYDKKDKYLVCPKCILRLGGVDVFALFKGY